jgi:hypothetical protein
VKKVRLLVLVTIHLLLPITAEAQPAAQSACACKQMKTCYGSWVRLTCNQLIDMCDKARSPIKRTKNSCDKVERLVRE